MRSNMASTSWLIAMFGEPEFSNHPIGMCAMMLKICLP
jgi:hypothetical protein